MTWAWVIGGLIWLAGNVAFVALRWHRTAVKEKR